MCCGQVNYFDLEPTEIWDAVQDIYRDYPTLLEAAWDTLKYLD